MRKLGALTLLVVLGISQVNAADPLQTQIGVSGDVEVDLIRIGASSGVLTAVFAYRNIGSEDIQIAYPVSSVYFLEKSEGKKYHVLTDEKGYPLATPLDGERIRVPAWEFKPGSKKLVWFKFPAPPDGTAEIDIVLPDALPFENVSLGE
jgi:hypothetical protein